MPDLEPFGDTIEPGEGLAALELSLSGVVPKPGGEGVPELKLSLLGTLLRLVMRECQTWS